MAQWLHDVGVDVLSVTGIWLELAARKSIGSITFQTSTLMTAVLLSSQTYASLPDNVSMVQSKYG
ncbi:hypothetical protein D9758_018058 [Tetrapyrgos nigripes]|uniref:Uncharacterized protein n=1 Tax=Tetrapyrgos nigripes TaxID=182062 RepID=A0A8H5F4A9_9AGAR|nr:hypothetical protein D9758_018058 [Tetrapyrgos nigripes]